MYPTEMVMVSSGHVDLGCFHRTLRVPSEEVPFVEYGEVGTPLSVRMVRARPSEDFTVSQLHAPGGSVTDLRRHRSPVFGWTNAGAWGHDRTYSYLLGSCIFETPGVPHHFYAGNEPVDALLVTCCNVEILDPEPGETRSIITPGQILDGYLAGCEAAAIAHPNVLN
jgi:hypothetical protein